VVITNRNLTFQDEQSALRPAEIFESEENRGCSSNVCSSVGDLYRILCIALIRLQQVVIGCFFRHWLQYDIMIAKSLDKSQ
jgi:hypothetical protein